VAELREVIAAAIGDPGSVLPSYSQSAGEPYETVTGWIARAVVAALEAAGYVLLRPGGEVSVSHECMYSRTYDAASMALDELLGTEGSDGCGQGLVAEIWHLARRCEHFEGDADAMPPVVPVSTQEPSDVD